MEKLSIYLDWVQYTGCVMMIVLVCLVIKYIRQDNADKVRETAIIWIAVTSVVFVSAIISLHFEKRPAFIWIYRSQIISILIGAPFGIMAIRKLKKTKE
jgi:ABC-type proline/glycine betaine transport system permease subunit